MQKQCSKQRIEAGVVIIEVCLSQPDPEAWDYFKPLFSYSRKGLSSVQSSKRHHSLRLLFAIAPPASSRKREESPATCSPSVTSDRWERTTRKAWKKGTRTGCRTKPALGHGWKMFMQVYMVMFYRRMRMAAGRMAQKSDYLKKKISCHSQVIAKWEVLSHQACHEWEKSPEQFMILAHEKV